MAEHTFEVKLADVIIHVECKLHPGEDGDGVIQPPSPDVIEILSVSLWPVGEIKEVTALDVTCCFEELSTALDYDKLIEEARKSLDLNY